MAPDEYEVEALAVVGKGVGNACVGKPFAKIDGSVIEFAAKVVCVKVDDLDSGLVCEYVRLEPPGDRAYALNLASGFNSSESSVSEVAAIDGAPLFASAIGSGLLVIVRAVVFGTLAE